MKQYRGRNQELIIHFGALRMLSDVPDDYRRSCYIAIQPASGSKLISDFITWLKGQVSGKHTIDHLIDP